MVSGLVHGDVGRVAPTNFFEVMVRMRFWAPRVKSSENYASPLPPWDASLKAVKQNVTTKTKGKYQNQVYLFDLGQK